METSFSSSEGTRRHALNLFSFLREFAQLRANLAISRQQPERIFWLAPFPAEELSYCIYRSPLEARREHDLLIEISKTCLESSPALQGIYAELLAIHQNQQKLGEAYEVVLAIGLLQWRTATDRVLNRHILTAQTNVSFENQSGRLRITASGDLRFELDMLDALELAAPSIQRALESELAEIGDLASASALKMILAKWIDSFEAHGQFVDSLSPEMEVAQHPLLCFAPAIVLRKKTERGLLSALSEISRQLADGVEIPEGIKELVGSEAAAPSHETGTTENEIWFPLPDNERQKEIVRALAQRQSVVVHVPPGTDKSNTIANLICHYLARGQRLLVATHTPQALHDFGRKIPAPLAALCAHAWGSKHELMKAIAEAMHRLTQQRTFRETENANARKSELENELNDLNNNLVQTRQQLHLQRDNETRQYSSLFGNYSGDMQTIAARLRAEEQSHSWLPDLPEENQEPPVTNDELNRLRLLLWKTPAEDQRLSGLNPFAGEELLTPAHFHELTRVEQSARKRFMRYGMARHNADFRALLSCNAETRSALRRSILLVLELFDRLQQAPEAWVRKALSEVIAGRITVWQRLGRDTHRLLRQARKRVNAVRNLTVEGVEGANAQLRADAARLLAHVRAGGGFGVGPFKRKVVKECDYLTKQLFVNGRPCDGAEELRHLIQYLELQEILEHLHEAWGHLVYINQRAALRLQLAEFKDHLKALARVLFFHSSLAEARKIALRALNNREPDWRDAEALHKLAVCSEAVEAGLAYYEAQRPFKKLESQILLVRQGVDHPLLDDLMLAVKRRDHALYSDSIHQLKDRAELGKLIEEKNRLLENLRRHAPVLARQLAAHCEDESWTAKLQNFAAAWNWARANRWLKSTMISEKASNLKDEIELLQNSISRTTIELAALQAWEYCWQRLTNQEEQHLIAWKKALDKAGASNEKYANICRHEARAHLEKCHSAMPCWIMPLDRVAEVFAPRSGLFDIAIIVEANHAGPEALLLMYCAKKIIVLGDGGQNGMSLSDSDRDEVLALRRKYLLEIPHNDFLDGASSFFDYLEIHYPRTVRLDEH